jgi:hypothetical protein
MDARTWPACIYAIKRAASTTWRQSAALGADAYGLHFRPHRDERCDLVIMEPETDSTPIKAMLDVIELAALCA